MSIGVKRMSDIMNYLLVVLTILSIMMMIDIKEKFRTKRDFFIHVVLLISIIMIMFKLVGLDSY